MKFVILLCFLSVLFLQCESSPVHLIESQDHQSRAISRQQATAVNDVAPAAASSADDDDDDDEDDDEDEPDLGDLVDDDDDDDDDEEEDDDDEEEDDTPQGQAAPAPVAASDDDEEDDDDEDDYLDRLFDDILGDDDDEDDDDDDVRPVAANPVQSPVAPAAPAAPIEDLAPIATNPGVSSGISDGVDLPLAETAIAAEPIAAGNTADDIASNNNNEGEQNVFYDEETSSNFLDDSFSSISSSISSNSDSLQKISSIGSKDTKTERTNSKNQNQNQMSASSFSTQASTKSNKLVGVASNSPPVIYVDNSAASVAGAATDADVNNVDEDDEDDDDDDYDDDDEDEENFVDVDLDDEEVDDGVDDITGALTGDDDEEESDDDEDDDDDDDIIGDDVIEARRQARNLKNNIIDMTSDAFQERHNHFIDAIFARINRIVSDNYDPFVVKLSTRGAAVKEATKTTATGAVGSKSTKSSATPAKKLKNTKSEPRVTTDDSAAESLMKADNANTSTSNKEQSKQEALQQQQQKLDENLTNDKNVAAPLLEMRTVPSGAESEAVATVKAAAAQTASNAKKSTASKTTQSSSSNKQSGKKGQHKSSHNTAPTKSNKQKLKQGVKNNAKDATVERLQKAEGSLFGLSSLKRVGNVKVVADPERQNSTIKAKFTLGPLILRVEKSFKRGSITNVKSATARTNEMMGRIKFSVVNDRATLMSIKVQQPKQVEVESKDNHDRTREFVWRRTPKIARLVSEKLKLAAESVFTPQGVEVVRL